MNPDLKFASTGIDTPQLSSRSAEVAAHIKFEIGIIAFIFLQILGLCYLPFPISYGQIHGGWITILVGTVSFLFFEEGRSSKVAILLVLIFAFEIIALYRFHYLFGTSLHLASAEAIAPLFSIPFFMVAGKRIGAARLRDLIFVCSALYCVVYIYDAATVDPSVAGDSPTAAGLTLIDKARGVRLYSGYFFLVYTLFCGLTGLIAKQSRVLNAAAMAVALFALYKTGERFAGLAIVISIFWQLLQFWIFRITGSDRVNLIRLLPLILSPFAALFAMLSFNLPDIVHYALRDSSAMTRAVELLIARKILLQHFWLGIGIPFDPRVVWIIFNAPFSASDLGPLEIIIPFGFIAFIPFCIYFGWIVLLSIVPIRLAATNDYTLLALRLTCLASIANSVLSVTQIFATGAFFVALLIAEFEAQTKRGEI